MRTGRWRFGPLIDRDTAGVAGSPAIADTILGKIARADIFVPDVSAIITTESGRLIPNPNVLLELGYAISQVGWDRILMVVNTAYGEVTQLPFDLRGHKVLTYALPDKPGEPKADVRRMLERRLKEEILSVIRKQDTRVREEDRARKTSLIQAAKEFRDERITRIRTGEGEAGSLASKHLVCVHAVPHGALSGDIHIDINSLDNRTTFASPIGARGYNIDFNAHGLMRLSNSGSPLDAYFQLFRDGVVESVNSRMTNGRAGLPLEFLAMSLTGFLTETVGMWRTIGVAPPACILVTLSGLAQIPLMLGGFVGSDPRLVGTDPLLLPAVVLEDFNADPRPLLRPALDALWQAAGASGCHYFNSDGHWIGRF